MGFSRGFLLDFSYGFFRWVCVVGAVLSCSDWVYLGFLLILGWVDFWVSVDFGIFFLC